MMNKNIFKDFDMPWLLSSSTLVAIPMNTEQVVLGSVLVLEDWVSVSLYKFAAFQNILAKPSNGKMEFAENYEIVFLNLIDQKQILF